MEAADFKDVTSRKIIKLYKNVSFQIFNNSNPEVKHLIQQLVSYNFCLKVHMKSVWVSPHLNQLT